MSRIKRGLKNFSYLTIGTVISQVIGFIGFIYIARYLGPDHYGVYVTVGAFVSIFQLLAIPGLRKVVVRECSKNLDNSEDILRETIGVQSLFILIAIAVMLFASLFTGYALTTKLYIAIFSLKLSSESFRGYFDAIYKSHERMEYLAVFRVVRMLIFVGAAISVLLLGYGLFGVVMVTVISFLIDVLLRFQYSKNLVSFNVFSKLNIDKKILKPSAVFSGISITSRLYKRVDLFMISLLGTAPEVAIYGVAYNIAREANLLKHLLGEAFFPIAVKTLHEGSVRKKMIVKYSIFFAIGMAALALIGFYLAEPAVILLFGEEYAESGFILRVLVFYMVAWFSTLPFTEAIKATGNEKVLLYGKGTMAGINIPLNIVLYLTYGLIGIAYSTLIVYTIGSVIINIYSYHLLNKQGYFG